MWTFPINSANTAPSSTSTDSPSSPSPPITIAKEVEPTACETECIDQQKALVACVDSIRAARLQQAEVEGEQQNDNDGDDNGDATTTTSTDTPECLSMAVAAWTKCCEEANLRQKEQQKEDEESND